jgi:hypothetical protein
MPAGHEARENAQSFDVGFAVDALAASGAMRDDRAIPALPRAEDVRGETGSLNDESYREVKKRLRVCHRQ